MTRISDFASRLAQTLTKNAVTAAWLAKETGVSKATISQYLSGKYSPKREKLETIAKKLCVNPDWLDGFDVPMTPEAPREQVHRLPVVRKAVKGAELTEKENILRYEVVAPELDNGEYFFMEADDHLYPAAKPGDRVLVRRCDELFDEQAGVIDIGQGGQLYIFRRRREYIELECTNAYYPPLRLSPEQEMTVIGRVVETRRKW